MKKYSTKIIVTILVYCLSIFLLVGCGGGGGNNELFNNNRNTSTEKSSQSTNTSSGGNNEHQSVNYTSENGDDSEVLDESNYPDFVFSIGNFLKPAGSVTVPSRSTRSRTRTRPSRRPSATARRRNTRTCRPARRTPIRPS